MKRFALALLILIFAALAGAQTKPAQPVPINFGEKLLKKYIGLARPWGDALNGDPMKRFRSSRLNGISFDDAYRILDPAFKKAGWKGNLMRGWEGSSGIWTSNDHRQYMLTDVFMGGKANLELHSIVPTSMLKAAKSRPKKG